MGCRSCSVDIIACEGCGHQFLEDWFWRGRGGGLGESCAFKTLGSPELLGRPGTWYIYKGRKTCLIVILYFVLCLYNLEEGNNVLISTVWVLLLLTV